MKFKEFYDYLENTPKEELLKDFEEAKKKYYYDGDFSAGVLDDEWLNIPLYEDIK